MKHIGRTILTAATLVAGFGLVSAAPASAGSSVYFGFSVGSSYHGGHHRHRYHHRHHYPRHYGHRHHHRWHGPTVIYVPPPVAVRRAPAPVYEPVCRRFDGNATVDGKGTRFHGVACLRSDGRWHIVEGR